MSYQVIARKYRPQRFEDVVGQEHVTQTLGNAIRSGRIAHAYLFCGPRGTGKTTVARIFAKALNCTDGPKADFDVADPRCQEIAEGRSLDVLEIDGASNNGVEQVRELRETARFAPASSRFKIYIIDEVHMLSVAAFNALLKTLEEPPKHVKFLFATTDPEKVLPTILSRCQRFDLRRIPSSLIVSHLASISRTEGVQTSDAALLAIARGADGGMRDAESTLDQLISFCGERIEEADVLAMFGLAARSQILALTRALLEARPADALRELDSLARNGKDLGRLLNDLLGHLRNLLVFQVAQGDISLLEVSELEAGELKELAQLAPTDAVTRVLEVFSAAEGRLRDAVARKIFFEVTLLKAIQARNAVSLDTVLHQLQRLRTASGSDPASTPATSLPTPPPAARARVTTPPAPASNPGVSHAPPPAPAPAPPSSAPTASPATATATTVAAPTPPPASSIPLPTGDPRALWEQVVVSAAPMTRASLQAGQPQSFDRGTLVVGFGPSHDTQRALVDTDRVRKAVEARLGELGAPATVRFVRLNEDPSGVSIPAATTPPSPALAPAATATPASSAAPAPRARPEKVAPIKIDPNEFKNDPLIREALELFKGHLVEVQRQEPPEAGR
ncbi:MAG: DNA polymerase III subunit gamma/tau [Verrucomicrobiales bacterium]|nr:DNA polymerase III subunit gamma/tau [Verrucomicrobiales bacterium]